MKRPSWYKESQKQWNDPLTLSMLAINQKMIGEALGGNVSKKTKRRADLLGFFWRKKYLK